MMVQEMLLKEPLNFRLVLLPFLHGAFPQVQGTSKVPCTIQPIKPNASSCGI